MPTYRIKHYLIEVNSDGEFVGGQADRVEVLENGREIGSSPVNITEGDLGTVFTGWNYSMTQQNKTLLNQIDVKNVETETLLARIRFLEAEMKIAATQVVAFDAEAKSYRTRFDTLVGQLKFDPRVLRPGAFMRRLSSESMFKLLSSEDPVIQTIAGRFKEYEKEKWEVHLDSDEVVNSFAYLIGTGVVSVEQSAEYTRDASRDEAVLWQE